MKHPYEALQYLEPQKGVWRATRESVLRSLFPHGGPNRRRDETKAKLEFRQAALFALGRAIIDSDASLRFAMTTVQRESVDAVFRSEASPNLFAFERVQLKEIVPEAVDPRQTLEALLEDVRRTYGSGEALTIAIHLNRDVVTALGSVKAPEIRGVAFWLFGIAGQNLAFIVRDPFGQFVMREFDLPKMPSSPTQW